MNTAVHISQQSFTIENCKWIKNFKKKEFELEAAMQLYLEIKKKLRSAILKKD